ncbi:hypothetical protein HS125_00285 [bacterium]|nr:hypothetical protein [bacterium]
MPQAPILLISSYPPRADTVAGFTEEAREFLARALPERDVLVICHREGEGEGVFPLIHLSRRGWWKPVVAKVRELGPEAIHLQHDYPLYEYRDERGHSDNNAGFLSLLEQLASDYPLVVELHTVHGRLRDEEADFIYQTSQYADVVILKAAYQHWRFDWTCRGFGWPTPKNIMVVPHGARPDYRWSVEDVPRLRDELGLDKLPGLAQHLVGLIGWTGANQRWDILTSMWEQCAADIRARSGQRWDLLAAGAAASHAPDDADGAWRGQIEVLERKGLAHYYEFTPRDDVYYKMLAVCDFVVLPSVDETQSGTLSRIIALNKPFITIAPMEALTAETIESEGGLLFTTKEGLRQKVVQLATDEKLRLKLGENLRRYLEEVVSWEVVVRHYLRAYELAREATRSGVKVELPPEF